MRIPSLSRACAHTDEFINTVSGEKALEAVELEREQRIAEGIQDLKDPRDPLMASLSKFSTQGELRGMIDDLFDVFDENKNGELDVEEMHAGLEKLVSRKLDSDAWGFPPGGIIDRDAFAAIMRNELRQYTQRQIVNAMGSESNASSYELHMGIKLLLDAQEDHRRGEEAGLSQRSGAGLEGKINEQLEQIRRDQSLMHASIQQLCQTQTELLQKVESQQTLMIKPHRAVKTINPLPARGRHGGKSSTAADSDRAMSQLFVGGHSEQQLKSPVSCNGCPCDTARRAKALGPSPLSTLSGTSTCEAKLVESAPLTKAMWNLVENLEKLAALRKQGALTEDEFVHAKAAAMAIDLSRG